MFDQGRDSQPEEGEKLAVGTGLENNGTELGDKRSGEMKFS